MCPLAPNRLGLICVGYIYKKRGACLSPILHIKNFHIARIVEMINAESPMLL